MSSYTWRENSQAPQLNGEIEPVFREILVCVRGRLECCVRSEQHVTEECFW